MIHEVLKFCRTLTKLSPIIKCDVSNGGCCKFTAGIYVDRVKQARISVSGTPVKWFITWLFFCISNTRDTFFLGTFFYLPVWGFRGLHRSRRGVSSRPPRRFLGELHPAFIVDRSIGCSHPGTWHTPVGYKSSS